MASSRLVWHDFKKTKFYETRAQTGSPWIDFFLKIYLQRVTGTLFWKSCLASGWAQLNFPKGSFKLITRCLVLILHWKILWMKWMLKWNKNITLPMDRQTCAEVRPVFLREEIHQQPIIILLSTFHQPMILLI